METEQPALRRRDVVDFYVHFCHGVQVSRHVLALLAALILAMTVVIALTEPLPFDEALYLALITAFTVGYGDIVPHTASSRIAAVLTAFLGLILFGMIVAISNNALQRTIEAGKTQRR